MTISPGFKMPDRPAAYVLHVRTLMLAVAVVGLVLAALARPKIGPDVTAAILAGCVVCLASSRYSEALASRRPAGETIGRWRRAVLVITSVTTAASILGLAMLGFAASYLVFMKFWFPLPSHWSPYSDPGAIAQGTILGTIQALWVASTLRRRAWPLGASRSPRRWLFSRSIVVTALLAILLVTVDMHDRYTFCRMMADYHAGPEARADGPDKAALHTWLKRWYARAAIRPWMPIHPDDIPKNL